MIAPEVSDDLLPLEMLHANEVGQVVELLGNEAQVHRLAEIGLRIGAQVRMVRPGSPCLLAIDGKRLSVRLNLDLIVLVTSSPAQ